MSDAIEEERLALVAERDDLQRKLNQSENREGALAAVIKTERERNAELLEAAINLIVCQFKMVDYIDRNWPGARSSCAPQSKDPYAVFTPPIGQ
jgi:hypothetical protein